MAGSVTGRKGVGQSLVQVIFPIDIHRAKQDLRSLNLSSRSPENRQQQDAACCPSVCVSDLVAQEKAF